MDGRDQARAPSGDERYQHLLDRLPCGVARCRVITDRDGRVDFVFDHASRRFEALTGLHDLVGQPLSAVVPGAAAAEPDKLATCARLALDGGAERFEIHVAAARRSFRAEVYGSAPGELTIIVDELGPRRRAEPGHAAADARLAMAFYTNAAALVITRRTDRRIVDANDRYMRMIGYHRDEVIGKTGLELGLVSPEIFRERQVELERMFATASERELESELRTRSGNRVIVHASIEAIDLPDEGPCLLTTLLDVTARRRAEEAFYQAFHAGPAGMLLIRVATSAAVEVNDSLLAMTGARRDTLLAEVPGALLSVMQPEPGPGGAATARELELTDAAGRAVTLLASTATIEIGDEPYRLGLFVDITDRKRAERRLALQHALSRALTELHEFNTALPRVLDELCRGDDWEFAACWLVDAADGTLRCYATSSAHDPASDALVATVRGMSIAPGAGFVGRVVATGALISTAIDHASFLQPEVALACGLRSAVGVPIASGGATHGVVALMSTRADRAGGLDQPQLDLFGSLGSKLALFIERVKAEQALRASEDRMKTVINALHEGLVIADSAGTFSHWNPAALRMHGLAPSDDVTRDLASFAASWQLATLDGEVLPPERWPLWQVLAGKPVRGVEVRVRRTDREFERVFAYGGVLVLQPTGAPLGVLTITDITERVAATQALRTLNAELERRVQERTAALAATNRDLEAFSYSVSHDLRAPLRAINGFAALVLDDHAAKLPADAQRMLGLVRDSGARMSALVDALLEFARLGQAALRPRPVDVDALVRGVVGELAPTRSGKHLALHVAPLAPCTADPALLRQVWINLIGNALKYSRDRDPQRIEIESATTADDVVYHVRDNGVGFDMRYADRLFRVFQRLHRDSEFEGTGIGLAAVHRIIERHGGRIWACSEPGVGTTVSFTLAPEHRS